MVIIDYLITKDQLEMDQLILNEEIIKTKVKENFKGIINFNLFDHSNLDEWKDYYYLRIDININIYSNLLAPISVDEWSQVIAELNKEKASEITEISYDLIKKAGLLMNDFIRKLINKVFK